MFNSNKGLSLIELSVGIAVLSIVALGVGQVLVSSVAQSKKTSVLHSASSDHYENLYRLKRLQPWRGLLPVTTQIGSCLAGRKLSGDNADASGGANSEPGSCYGLERSVINASGLIQNCAGAECYSESTVTAVAQGCSANACASIHVTLTTKNTKENLNTKDKVSTFVIPGILLNELASLNYACAEEEERISSLNYTDSEAVCNFAGAPVYSCVTGPLSGAGGCQPLENVNCAHGIGNAGIMAGQSSCSVPGL